MSTLESRDEPPAAVTETAPPAVPAASSPAAAPLRILLVEDADDDALLLEVALRKSGMRFELQRVATRDELVAALSGQAPSVVVSDYSLPGFDGLSALEIARARHPGIPFVFASGTIGEERALEALRLGADDYVLKDRTARLGKAIEQAVARAAAQRDRQRAEDELWEANSALWASNERLRAAHDEVFAVIEQSPVAIVTIGGNGRVRAWNPAAERMFGWSARDVIGRELPLHRAAMPAAESVPVEVDLANLHRARQARVGAELAIARRDRDVVHVSLSLTPLSDARGRGDGVIAVFLDIAQRKRAEQLLRQQRDELAARTRIVEGSWLSQSGVDGFLPLFLSEALRLVDAELGVARVCYAGRQLSELRRGCGPKLEGVLARLDSARPPSSHPAATVWTADENGLPQEPSWMASDGMRQAFWVPLSSAVTESGDELEGPLPLGSPQRAGAGVTSGWVLIGRRNREAFGPHHVEQIRSLANALALAVSNTCLNTELRFACEELRRTQRAVLQHERLQSMTEMAAGLAHDLNNAVLPVIGFSDLVLHDDMAPPGILDSVRLIRKAGENVAAIVGRMRQFYRKREESDHPLPVDLARVIEDVVELTRPRWKRGAESDGRALTVRAEIDAAVPKVLGLENEVHQALTNLVLNAIDALAETGEITIRLRIEPGTHPVVVEVEDDGMGMDDATRERCLEPFFTTKGERGTGLGLAMVYGTMKRHNGRVEIDSTLGQGTRFRLRFPDTAEATAAMTTAPS